MRKIIKSRYAPFFLTGLAITIICSWFSVGYLFPDEHFSYFEFCGHKMGNIQVNSQSVPWEFYFKIRASLLPSIAYIVAKIIDWCDLYNPFTLNFLLRLFTGLFSWFITCRLCLLLLPKFKTKEGYRLLIVMSLFLWFIPYLAVRYTSENIAGITFLYGIYFILSVDEKQGNIFKRYFIAGLFFGVSFFIREQMLFAMAGFGAWLIFINKINWKPVFMLAVSMLISVGINIIIDHWFYGEWTFILYNYYYAQMIQHAISMLGTEPWWWFFPAFITKVIPPLSWLLLVMFFIGVFKNIQNPFVWIIVPFFVGHCIIVHKELRFLFPVTFIFIYITALGFDYLLYKQPQPKNRKVPLKNNWIKAGYQKIHKYVYILLVIISIPMLAYRTFAPAQVAMYSNEFLYNNAVEKNTPIFYIPKCPWDIYYSLNTSFYKNPNLKTVLVDSIPQIGDYLLTNKPKTALFFCYAPLGGINDSVVYNGYRIKLIYSSFPSWIYKYDYNKWIEKESPNFSIYQFIPVPSFSGFDANKQLQDIGSLQNPSIITAILSSAYRSLENDKLDEAEKVLTILETNTKGRRIPNLHNYLGMLYFKENMDKAAENEFNTEITLNLQKEKALLNLGMLYFREKDYDKAIISMNNTIKINPNNSDAFNNIGVYLAYIKKDYAGAMKYFKRAVDINPNYGQGYYNIMICAPRCNDMQAMIKYQRLLLDDRKDPYTW